MEEIDFREIRDAGLGLPCRNWEGVLPTQVVLNSNLVNSENFIQFCLSIQKLFMVFFNTDGQTNRQTDTQPPYKTNHPTTLYGYGWNFFVPHFLYLSQNGARSLHFVWINI